METITSVAVLVCTQMWPVPVILVTACAVRNAPAAKFTLDVGGIGSPQRKTTSHPASAEFLALTVSASACAESSTAGSALRSMSRVSPAAKRTPLASVL